MSVTIKYKGNTIASANTDTTKTIKTSGKYCEADIVVENVQDGGITPSGSITLTSENTYDVTSKASAVVDFSATRANLAEAVTAKGVDTLPTSSFDTIATNIGLISGGGGGLPSSISKIDGGSFTPASDTLIGNYTVSHNLGEAPKGVVIFSDREGGAYSVETVSSALKVNNTQQFEALIDVATTGSTNTRGQSITAGSLTTTEWYFKRNNTYYKAGVTYKWIAWA